MLNTVLGVLFVVLRRLTGGRWYAHEPTRDQMPVSLHAPLTMRQMGEWVRRLLFWRYLLVWHKPSTRTTH